MSVAEQMLLARGHIINKKTEDTILATTKTQKDVIVRYFPKQKFSIGMLSQILESYKSQNFSEFIVVCESIMKKNLEKAENNNLEIFTEDELKFNILDHHLQPQFKKLPSDVCVPKNLPQMKESDAVAKFLKFREGDVIQINSSSYRIVVKG
jgi:DNA-directed RNA polymerase subunit H (RpoH/RPB5)